MRSTGSERRNSRGVAAGIIARWLRTGLFPDRLIPAGTADRAFVVEVVYGVVKRQRTLQWVVDRCVDRKPDSRVVPYLYVGLYQILMMDSVSEYAAVAETVEAFKAERLEHITGLVNGLLRRVLRERETLVAELARQDIGVSLSHPDALVERWCSAFGRERTEALCRWNNERGHVVITPNPMKTTLAELRRRLQAAGVNPEPHPHAPDSFLLLPHGTRVTPLPGFVDGHFSVQDPSTFEAVRLLDPRPGERILDACAAPGGKTTLIAGRMRDEGDLVCMDLYRDRIGALEMNIKRLGFKSARIREGNAAIPADIRNCCEEPVFDRIMLDAPCSNTGVMQRRPDARWRFSAERLAQLVKIQKALLNTVSEFVKPGGVIVYSTCSLEDDENGTQVEHWLQDHPDFTCTATTTLFPPESQTDGVFAAALKRLE